MATKKTASTASAKRPAASKTASKTTSKTAGKTAGKKASASRKTLPYPFANLPLPAPLNEKAQQIWAAGLAAFANAQAEGGKVGQLFETLVQEGQSLQRKAQDLAGMRVQKAQDRINSLAKDITATAAGKLDRFEGIFEGRVERVMDKFGVPSAREMGQLLSRIEELNERVVQLTQAITGQAVAPVKKARAATAKPAAKAPAAKKAAAKKSAARQAKPKTAFDEVQKA
ncbi:phasin family protein [Comamonas badia]|uniref:phasin family protein n=1 Tax=Comamonas badia TaxID=265291 RepID=UPI00041BCF23|nr:phasin family protein [Comamonas badia]